MRAATFSAPGIDYRAVLPMLIVFGAAVAGVLVEAFTPRRVRHPVQAAVSLLALVAALVAVVRAAGTAKSTAGGAVVVDGPALFLQGTLLVLAILAVLCMAERSAEVEDAFAPQAAAVPGSADEDAARRDGRRQTEVFPLTMFAVGGMLLFPASNDLLTMFIALEVLSLPLYLLCGLARRRRLLSQEASLKYFLLGAFSSGLLLYGIALLYGYAGSVRLQEISDAVTQRSGADGLLLLGLALLLIGLLFKIGAVPFHAWTPDVYQGAPTPVTGFMAACTKVAAFGALLRVLYVALPGTRWDVQPLLWAVAVATMAVGAVVAIVQTDVKRMLAYSSIAHAGFLLVGVLAMDRQGISSVLFYLLAYGLATVGAFAVVTLVRDAGGEATALSQWAGLARRSPTVAAAFSLFLLAFAGIPFTSGFISKFTAFGAAVAHGAVLLAVVGVLASAVAFGFYTRVIVLMYFASPATSPLPDGSPSTAPAAESGAGAATAASLTAGAAATASAATTTAEPAPAAPAASFGLTRVATPSVLTAVTVGVAAAATLAIGVFPSPLLDVADRAALFVR